MKKTGWQAKIKRAQRRVADMSGDILSAAGLLILSVLLAGFFVYGYSWVVSHPYFQVKEISVRGVKELTDKDILTLAEVKPAQNLLAVSTGAVMRRVSKNPWVREVHVGRELPDKLVLEVRERTPLALLRLSNDFYLVDVEGFVFKKLSGADAVDLPIITGVSQKDEVRSPMFLNALNLLKALSHAPSYTYLGAISEMSIDPIFGISIITEKGLYLKLGTEQWEKKIGRLKIVLDDLEKRGMKTAFLCIDLSDVSKVTVQRKSIPDPEQGGKQEKRYNI